MPRCRGLLDQQGTLSQEAQVRAIFSLLLLQAIASLIFHAVSFLVALASDWTRVEEDCRKALELDNSSVKVIHVSSLLRQRLP